MNKYEAGGKNCKEATKTAGGKINIKLRTQKSRNPLKLVKTW